MSKKLDLPLTPLDELFTTEEQRQDDEMDRLCESIKEYGVLSPLMARPLSSGGYEIVSGHRRKIAAELLGIEKLPVLVRDMTDDEAVILMVDSNIQRENLLPSEKAFAYKMKLEAMKHQGKALDSSCAQVGHKSRDIIAEQSGESREQIRRYICLTELAPPLLELVDQKRIAFSPAVELSYLTKEEQAELWSLIESEDCTPSFSQSVRMKKLSQEAKLTPEVIYSVMTEEKPNQKEQVRIQTDKLKKYFPRGYSASQMEEAILKLLEERRQKRQRQRNDTR